MASRDRPYESLTDEQLIKAIIGSAAGIRAALFASYSVYAKIERLSQDLDGVAAEQLRRWRSEQAGLTELDKRQQRLEL